MHLLIVQYNLSQQNKLFMKYKSTNILHAFSVVQKHDHIVSGNYSIKSFNLQYPPCPKCKDVYQILFKYESSLYTFESNCWSLCHWTDRQIESKPWGLKTEYSCLRL